MNPHAAPSTSLLALGRSIQFNKSLILNLVKREILGRYRGSVMGMLWSFVNPVLMLTVYTFVFSVVFKARWSGGTGSKTEFALVLFAGLMIFNLFAECINRAPSLILNNVNYVKKVIFPLELLPLVSLGSAGFHFVVNFGVWLVFYLVFFGLPPVTIFWLPLVLVPFLLIIVGFSYVLASLGVYIRDVVQMIGVLTTVLMFMSPIFYPVDALPAQYHALMYINPVTFVVEQARTVMIFGGSMKWASWGIQLLVSMMIAWIGFAWFQKTRKEFADVI